MGTELAPARRHLPGQPAGRYRWRTLLRASLPSPLSELFPKGQRDCGEHDWYRSDEHTDRCYHCDAGERPHELIDGPLVSTELAAALQQHAR